VATKEQRRAYQKRRYEKWAAGYAQKSEQRRRLTRLATVLGAGACVVGVAVALALAVGGHQPAKSAKSAKNTAASPCPTPTVKPADKPQSWPKPPAPALAQNTSWTWNLTTTCGNVSVVLDGKAAPQAVSSMIFLTQNSFFSGVTCHRLTVTGIYVLQCGDPTGTGSGGPGYQFGPLENVPKDFVYPAGTVAMARSASPTSNGSQFFILYKDSTIGDAASGGYTAIGKVTSGLEVIQHVADGGTADTSGNGGQPKRAISIVSASVVKGAVVKGAVVKGSATSQPSSS
jgi:peptidyl-prolyl cis-trans isomerase B (cyclophilin B)